MKEVKICDLINSLRVLYKYIKFREKISEIFPNFSINSLGYINIYNFDEFLKLIFSNIRLKNSNIEEKLIEIMNEFGDINLEELKHCINIIRQFYIIDKMVMNTMYQLANMHGLNMNNILDFVKPKSEVKLEENEHENITDEEFKIDKKKLDIILTNKK